MRKAEEGGGNLQVPTPGFSFSPDRDSTRRRRHCLHLLLSHHRIDSSMKAGPISPLQQTPGASLFDNSPWTFRISRGGQEMQNAV